MLPEMEPTFLRENSTSISLMTTTVISTFILCYLMMCMEEKIDKTYNILKEVINNRKAQSKNK